MPDIGVVLPTRNRAEKLAPLVENIHAVTDASVRVYAVAERDDAETVATLERIEDVVPVIGTFGCYVAASNAGVAETTERYVLVANDDCWFHDGWDSRVLAEFKDGVRVVGVDQGNGRTDCFFLADRAYVEEHGLYHDGYRSQYCETEFCDLAKERGVWAEATGDLIEHRHWTLGKSAMDENYHAAVAAVPDDERLYRERRRLRAA